MQEDCVDFNDDTLRFGDWEALGRTVRAATLTAVSLHLAARGGADANHEPEPIRGGDARENGG